MITKDITAIDSALGLINEFNKLTHHIGEQIHQMREKIIFSDGNIPAKFKVLGAALWGVNARCEPCLKYYILKAKELGITEKEAAEFLAIASVMGGCVGEMWALKAYQTFKDENRNSTSTEHCCT